MALFLTFVLATFVTMALIPPLIRTAERWQFVDLPDDRKVHKYAVPRVGGIAMAIGAIVPLLLWPGERALSGLLAGAAVIVAFGVWDDRKNLDYRIKFLGQFIGAVTAVTVGGLTLQFFPFSDTHAIAAYISIPLSIIFLIATTNAVNLSDGLDGLAGGTSLISLAGIAILGFFANDVMVVLMALAVIGSILGFLRFNTHPAKIFMGDGGSQFLGFALGVLSLLLTQRSGSIYSPVLPLLVLGLPLLDTAMVMVQRVAAGRSPFAPDKNHIHHKLLTLGASHHEAVFIIYSVQAALMFSAYLFRYQSDAFILVFYAAFVVMTIGSLNFALKFHWRVRMSQRQKTFENAITCRTRELLAKWAGIGILVLPIYLVVGAVSIEKVFSDIGVLALIIFLVLLVELTRRRHSDLSWYERGSVYVISTYIVYLVDTAPGLGTQHPAYSTLFFVALALMVVLGFRFSNQPRFNVTTLDFIVIFAAFALTWLPGSLLNATAAGELVTKIIVLFYALELLLSNAMFSPQRVRYLMLALSGVLTLRGFLEL